MRVFITGGTGYLGSVLVERILGAGHDVTALARSAESAARLTRAGATAIAGGLRDTDILADAAAGADAVIHAAVDYSMTEEANAIELAAVAALAEGAGRSAVADPTLTGTPVVFASTGLVYGFEPDRRTDEDADLPEVSAQPVKAAAERIVLGAPGIAAIVIRAGLIFGRGGSGLLTGLVRSAVANRVATYIDDGANTWMPVHVDDLADLYLRAVEAPVAGVYNAAGSVPFSFRELAQAIGTLTGVPTASIPLAAAVERLGPAARILATTSRLEAAKAGAVFGWTPEPRSLVADVVAGSYTAQA